MSRFVRFTIAAGVVAGVAAAASAQIRQPGPLSVQALGGDAGQVLRGPALYTTGFEAAEGYAVGPIEPQVGWTASGTNLPYASVDTSNPYAGGQHLRMVFDDTVGFGAQRVVLSPTLGTISGGQSSTSVMVYISSDGGANYNVIGQAPSQGLLTWNVTFNWNGGSAGTPGEIFILDDLGSGLTWVDTNVVWNEGVYTELRVETDSVANTIRYYYGGNLIYTGVAGIFAGTSVEQVVFATDNFQEAGEFADFDNILVVPAPGALAVMGLGVVGAARRRRR